MQTSYRRIWALFHFQFFDKLFSKTIAEYIYCGFMMGHLGSIIPPVLYRISLSAVEHPTIEDLCNFIYAFVWWLHKLHSTCFSTAKAWAQDGRWKQIPDCISVSPLSCCHLADRLWAITCSVGILAE